jgi:hypothetical protein
LRNHNQERRIHYLHEEIDRRIGDEQVAPPSGGRIGAC